MPRRPGWSRPPSTAHAFQSVANLFGCQRGQLRVRHRYLSFAAFLEPHRGGRDLDFQAPLARPDIERLTGVETQAIAKCLGNNNSPGSIYGSFHTIKLPKNWYGIHL